MRKYFGFVILLMGLIIVSACTPTQLQGPADVTSTRAVETSTSTPERQTATLSEGISPQDEHQECTHIEHTNCNIDTSAYVTETEADEPSEIVVTAETEEQPQMDSTHVVDKLLLDYEIVFYQSDFERETGQLSEIFANAKPTVLVFWAGLCPVCKREMPEIQAAYELYGEDVNFVGIDVGLFTNLGSKDDALTMIDELGLTFPIGVTLDYTALPTYEVTAIPTTLFMKPDGQIIRKESTYLNQDALIERINTLLEHSQG